MYIKCRPNLPNVRCIGQEDINIFVLLSSLVPCLIINHITFEILKLFMLTFEILLQGREIQEQNFLTKCKLFEEMLFVKSTNSSLKI